MCSAVWLLQNPRIPDLAEVARAMANKRAVWVGAHTNDHEKSSTLTIECWELLSANDHPVLKPFLRPQ
jgi:hypothetical protein